jgi:hypothetical protein
MKFKNWIISELANYGDGGKSSFKKSDGLRKLTGGTEPEPGENLFDVIDGATTITELAKLPPLGPNFPVQVWENIVEFGDNIGAIQIECTTLGSLRFMIRKKINDLQGVPTWICKHVRPISDIDDQYKEIDIAHNLYDNQIKKFSEQLLEGPVKEYSDFDRFIWRLWAGVRKRHPSYAMYPVSLRQQNENYYKMIFEFRGQGAGPTGDAGYLRQFDIDVFWDRKKGLIRCWGYDIMSDSKKSAWNIQPSDWDEWFSPIQDTKEIIECIVNVFMQY